MFEYLTFLRAINVGGHTAKMDHLRRLFEALGFANVETFIASGNVIFASPSKSAKALEKKIEKHLHESLGYEVATFIRTTAELAAIAQYQPFSVNELNDKGNKLYIAFTADSPSAAAKRKLLASATEPTSFTSMTVKSLGSAASNFTSPSFPDRCLKNFRHARHRAQRDDGAKDGGEVCMRICEKIFGKRMLL